MFVAFGVMSQEPIVTHHSHELLKNLPIIVTALTMCVTRFYKDLRVYRPKNM